MTAGGSIRGVALGGFSVEARDRLEWLGVAAFRVRATEARGAAMAGWVDIHDMEGVSVAGYHRIRRQTGLAVGLYNHARDLKGIQIGLLNRVDSNPAPFRILPLINARFR